MSLLYHSYRNGLEDLYLHVIRKLPLPPVLTFIFSLSRIHSRHLSLLQKAGQRLTAQPFALSHGCCMQILHQFTEQIYKSSTELCFMDCQRRLHTCGMADAYMPCSICSLYFTIITYQRSRNTADSIPLHPAVRSCIRTAYLPYFTRSHTWLFSPFHHLKNIIYASSIVSCISCLTSPAFIPLSSAILLYIFSMPINTFSLLIRQFLPKDRFHCQSASENSFQLILVINWQHILQEMLSYSKL